MGQPSRRAEKEGKMDHNAHVVEYIEFRETMEWNAACEQMMRAEGDWEDKGCRSLPSGMWGRDE